MPRSGAAPACDDLPSTVRYAEPMPLVARRMPPSLPPPSNESTASWSAATRVIVLREPGELISSSPLTSTVSVA